MLKVLHVDKSSNLATPSFIIARKVRILWGFTFEGPVQRFIGIPAFVLWTEETELRGKWGWQPVWGVSRTITDRKLIAELQRILDL